jgi:hypothetical protein
MDKSRNPVILRDKDRHYSLFKSERTKLDDAVKSIKEYAVKEEMICR